MHRNLTTIGISLISSAAYATQEQLSSPTTDQFLVTAGLLTASAIMVLGGSRLLWEMNLILSHALAALVRLLVGRDGQES